MTEPDRQDLRPPDSGTEAAARYYTDAFTALEFLAFLVDTVVVIDWSAFRLAGTFDAPGQQFPQNPTELAARQPGTRTVFLRKNSQLLQQLFLTRFVDNLQVYLVEIIRAVLVKQPRILTSKEPRLSLEYAFQFSTLDELIADLIESKVNSLSYQGLARLQTWCVERGIPLTIPDVDIQRLTEVIETRNIISHNRGLIDQRYLRNVASTNRTLGALRELDPHEVNEQFALLNRVVRETDRAVITKFGLPTVPISSSASAEPTADAQPGT